MGKFIDETNNKYGYLTVMYRVKNTSPIKWHCKCDCGNECDVLGTSLRNGNTKSCGCYQKKRAKESNIKRGGGDLIGKKFGKLTVIDYAKDRLSSQNKNIRYYKCQCSCGNITEVAAFRLTSGHTQSCGCLIKEKVSEKAIIREEGNVYGKLTVIEEAGRDSNGRVLWKCQCECGNEKIALGKSLRAGLVSSCGCLHSKGESKIALILQSLNIEFIQQYHYNDLKTNKNYYLYFDFYLPEYNILIEYQGEQHYQPILRGYYTEESFNELKERDSLKKEYCNKNKIKLIEIPYTDYDKLNKDYMEVVIG